MENLKGLIADTTSAFLAELEKNVSDGNKAAGIRARKLSLELEKLLKRYRKESVK